MSNFLKKKEKDDEDDVAYYDTEYEYWEEDEDLNHEWEEEDWDWYYDLTGASHLSDGIDDEQEPLLKRNKLSFMRQIVFFALLQVFAVTVKSSHTSHQSKTR